MEFSQELCEDVLSGQITVSYRLWRRPKVKAGGRYRVKGGQIEVDSVEVVPFSCIDDADVQRSGEADLEFLRDSGRLRIEPACTRPTALQHVRDLTDPRQGSLRRHPSAVLGERTI